MTDAPLIAPDDADPAPARRTPWLPVAVALLVLALVAAGAGWWWWTNNRATVPDWDRLPEVVLAAPAGDAFAPDTPWVQAQLAPLRPDAENTIQAAVGYREATPVPAAGPPQITAVTAQPVSGEPTDPESAVITAAENGAPLPLDQAGWQRLAAEVAGFETPAAFYLLVPDPNINGPNAVPGFTSSAEAEAIFQRGLTATTALQSVRYVQWIADGSGNAAVSQHVVSAGSDGEPPAFSFRITGGTEVIIIGSTRWSRPPGGFVGWQRQEGAAFLPPSEWGEEYSDATGFTLLGEETIDGETTQIVAFVAPEQTEPRRRTIAWYLWWVGTESGQVRREAMVSRQHYMLNQFSDFNEPMHILPPDEGGTPAAGTPLPAATAVP